MLCEVGAPSWPGFAPRLPPTAAAEEGFLRPGRAAAAGEGQSHWRRGERAGRGTLGGYTDGTPSPSIVAEWSDAGNTTRTRLSCATKGEDSTMQHSLESSGAASDDAGRNAAKDAIPTPGTMDKLATAALCVASRS